MKYIKQLCIIAAVCLVAEAMEHFIPLPVAASIYGLLIMLLLLVTKVVKLEMVEDVADFLTGNLAIMFIPPTVGIMACVEEVKAMLVPLFVISALTTLLIMAVTGKVSEFIIRKSKKEEK